MRTKTNRTLYILLPAVVLAATSVGLAGNVETPELRGLNRNQQEEFLETAKVVRKRALSVGVTRSSRLTVTNGVGTHQAHWQTVDEFKHIFPNTRGTELNFRDCYKFNIAAYRLDEMLGLNMVPVSVARKIGGESGALTWWVDDVLMMEKKRWRKKIAPPDQKRWNEQMYRVRVFNELVYNTDANLGNLLITNDWNLWMVDFTRAFRTHNTVRDGRNLERIDRELLDRLRALDETALAQALRPYLRKNEIRGLLARRDRIVEFFDDKMARLGEAAVYSDAPER